MECGSDFSSTPDTCRLCLTTAEPRFSIFTDEINSQVSCLLSLPENIMSLIQVQVSPEDGLPNCICAKCYSHIKDFINFKQQCELSYKLLHSQVTEWNNSSLDNQILTDAEDFEIENETVDEEQEPLNLIITESTGNADIEWNPDIVIKQEPLWTGYDLVHQNVEGNEIFNSGLNTDFTNKHPLFDVPLNNLNEDDMIEDILNMNFTSYKGRYKTSRWQCIKCRRLYSENGRLAHIKLVMSKLITKTEEQSFQCQFCSLEFSSKCEIQLHIYSSHKECKQCGVSFTPEMPREQHTCEIFTKPDSELKSYKCRSCFLEFSSRSEVQLHIYSAHRQCRHCCILFTPEAPREQHVCDVLAKSDSESKTFKCHSCYLEFPTRKEISVHISDTHKSCRLCGKKFTPEVPRDLHACIDSSLHNDKTAQEENPTQESANNDSEKKRRIRKTNNLSTSFKCPCCDSKFDSPTSLKIHFSRIHKTPNTNTTANRCVHCKKSCSSYAKLCRHIRKFHKNRDKNDVLSSNVTRVDQNQVHVERKSSLVKKKHFSHKPFPKNNFLANFENITNEDNLFLYKCVSCTKTFKTPIGAFNHFYFVKRKLNENKSTDLLNQKLKKIKTLRTIGHSKTKTKLVGINSSDHPAFNKGALILVSNFEKLKNESSGKTNYKCIHCFKTYSNSSGAYNHVAHIEKKFPPVKHLSDRKESDHDSLTGVSKQSDKKQVRFLPSNIKEIPDEENVVYKCLHCSKNYLNYRAANKHSINVQQLNTCWTCQKTFDSDKLLKLHLTRKHQYKLETSKTRKNEESDGVIDPKINKLNKRKFKDHGPFHTLNGKPSLLINFEKISLSPEVDIYKCLVCNKELTGVIGARSHYGFYRRRIKRPKLNIVKIKVKPKLTDFKCKTCSATFKTRSLLMFHRSKMHKIKLLTDLKNSKVQSDVGHGGRCEVCQQDFDDIIKHTKSKLHHAAKKNIQKQTSDVDSLPVVQHKSKNVISKKKIQRIIMCKKCYKVFQTENDLTQHIKTCDVEQEKECINNTKYVCSVCNNEIFTLKSYLQHLSSDHNDHVVSFQCGMCSLSYTIRHSLLRHMKIKHKNEKVNYSVVCSKKEGIGEEKEDKIGSLEVDKDEDKIDNANFDLNDEETIGEIILCDDHEPENEINSNFHSETKNRPHGNYNCALCEETFQTEDELIQHIGSQTHIENRNLKLRKCH